MNTAKHLLRSARFNPTAPAVANGPAVVLSYGELARRSASIAGALRGRFGLEAGGDSDTRGVFCELPTPVHQAAPLLLEVATLPCRLVEIGQRIPAHGQALDALVRDVCVAEVE